MSLFATGFAFVVILLGAYTRLTDAGLGCPDWPGCYGHIGVPQTSQAIERAVAHFPGTPVEPVKAWTEMVHRYFAGVLVLLVVGLLAACVRRRKQGAEYSLGLPLLLLAVIGFQAALGMWTVTWQLLPTVVMGHLLGGFTVLSLLWWLNLRFWGADAGTGAQTNWTNTIRPWAWLGLVILGVQIMLGGWTSANYAGLSCPDFPYCQGHWVPLLQWKSAFDVLHPIGVNYDGGVLDNGARMTINTVHRFWAVATALYLAGLGCLLMKHSGPWRLFAGAMLILLVVQVALGIINVIWLLPLFAAVAHNGVAALLLLSLLAVLFALRPAGGKLVYR